MENFHIIVISVSITSSFWFGFFLWYEGFIKKAERKKVEKLFKDKKW
jgi:hypothetical protein